jgi:hypothetical protein
MSCRPQWKITAITAAAAPPCAETRKMSTDSAEPRDPPWRRSTLYDHPNIIRRPVTMQKTCQEML